MIIGIGHDITSLKRMEKLLQSGIGSRFQERILTAEEQELASSCSGSRLAEFVGGRFAAKEAVSKAFGCGIGSLLAFTDIAVGRDASGKPVCTLTREAWARLGRTPDETRIHLTITHEEALASAFVVVERMQRTDPD